MDDELYEDIIKFVAKQSRIRLEHIEHYILYYLPNAKVSQEILNVRYEEVLLVQSKYPPNPVL